MIEYFKNLFTKPEYQWSLLDRLTVVGLVVCLTLVIVGILFVVLFIREKVKRNKQGGKDEN